MRSLFDSDQKHIITNYSRLNPDGIAVSADHLLMKMEIKLQTVPIRKQNLEIFNFNDKKGQETFKYNTSETKEFTDCFENLDSVLEQADMWLQKAIKHCKKTLNISESSQEKSNHLQ